MLTNFIDRLPSMGGSQYIEAQRRDPELLDVLLDLDEDDEEERPAWHPAGHEWTQADELLASIYDALAALVAIQAAHPLPEGARRPQIPQPYTRPERPIEGLRRERLLQRQLAFEEEVEEAKRRWRDAGGVGGGACVVIDHDDFTE